MSFISSIRDGENIGEAMVQRGQMAQLLADCPVVGGVGTGFQAGVVGKMNGAAGADPNHFSVQANGSNLVLTIRPGWAWIVKDSGASTFDPRVVYIVMNAAVTLTVPSNSQGTSRTDTICLRFDQSISPDATGSNLPTIVDVQGGASNALGNAPNDGALYLPLANVVIANGAASVTQSNVTDRRFVNPSQAKFKGIDLVARTFPANGTAPAQLFPLPTNPGGYDPTGMYSVSLGGWVVPVPGKYRIAHNIQLGSTGTTTAPFLAIASKNVPGTNAGWLIYGNSIAEDQSSYGAISGGSGDANLAYGDVLYCVGFNEATVTFNSSTGFNETSNFLVASWVGF